MTGVRNYYRRDQASGISPPDPSKICTFAEHIVRARGKRTQYTSISLDPDKIRDFGDALYMLHQAKTTVDGHSLVEHEALMTTLRETVQSSSKAERVRALQALRYADRRREGLVQWAFNTSAVEPKDMIRWAEKKVQDYFSRVR